MNVAARLNGVKWVVASSLLLAMALSPRLWLADRPFPTVPALQFLPDLPQGITLALVGLFVASVIAVAILPRPGLFATLPLVTASVLALFDLNRLQPWFYFYLLLLCGLAAMGWRTPTSQRARATVALCGFVIIATYFWSGLQKANGTFASEVFPWLLRPLGAFYVDRLRAFWFVAPVVEAAIGVMLFIPRSRRWALGLAAVMHLGILLAIGPAGLNLNSVVWPWNVCVPILAFVLFYRNDRPVLDAAWMMPVGKVVVVLAGILPAMNFVGLWDTPLSASLYSGKSTDGWIYLTPPGASRLILPEFIRGKALIEDVPGRFQLDISQWAQSALNVPPYGEPRVYRRIMQRLEESGIPREQMTLVLRVQPGIGDVSQTYIAMTDW